MSLYLLQDNDGDWSFVTAPDVDAAAEFVRSEGVEGLLFSVPDGAPDDEEAASKVATYTGVHVVQSDLPGVTN